MSSEDHIQAALLSVRREIDRMRGLKREILDRRDTLLSEIHTLETAKRWSPPTLPSSPRDEQLRRHVRRGAGHRIDRSARQIELEIETLDRGELSTLEHTIQRLRIKQRSYERVAERRREQAEDEQERAANLEQDEIGARRFRRSQ